MFKQSKARADVNKQCPFNDCDTLLTAVPAWLDRIAISVRQTETQLWVLRACNFPGCPLFQPEHRMQALNS